MSNEEEALELMRNTLGRGNRQERGQENDNKNENEIVYEDRRIKIVSRKSQHKRHTRFNLEDVLYTLKVEEKTRGRLPLLMSIEEGLKQSLISILEKLQNMFDKDNHHQVRNCFIGIS